VGRKRGLSCYRGFQEELAAEQEKYAALQRLIFGPKSEKHQKEDSKQDFLFNEAEIFCEAPDRKPGTVLVGQHERNKAGRKSFPDNFEGNEIVYALSNEERAYPSCEALRPGIGEERKEELRLIAAKAVIDVHVMKRYSPCRCKECHSTETAPINRAPGNAKIISGSRFSNGMITFFLTSKFVEGQPSSLTTAAKFLLYLSQSSIALIRPSREYTNNLLIMIYFQDFVRTPKPEYLHRP